MSGIFSRRLFSGFLFLFFIMGCSGSPSVREGGHVPLFKNLGKLHYPVTTSSGLAQKYFDQGLRLTFAFNHAEAIAAFTEAARLDSQCGMCYWGIALAFGPNINLPMEPSQEKEAFDALQKAVQLAETVTPKEQALIGALSKRYGEPFGEERAVRDWEYAEKMKKVVEQFPEDPDVATFYAEALMNLSPWNYWTQGGEPRERTTEIVATLESVLEKNPNHPGACHYYIHTVEASLQPERGLPCALRLGNLMPGAGHLVHMPAHIFMRVGRYQEAVSTNAQAVSVDEHYMEGHHSGGFYPMLYYPHNIHFLWAAASMEGRSEESMKAARTLVEKVPHHLVREIPPLEFFSPTLLFSMARFGKWDEILEEPKPPVDFTYTQGIWHFARGLALIRIERTREAETEFSNLMEIVHATPEEHVVGLNSAKALLQISSHILEGEMVANRGDINQAVFHFEEGIQIEEGLTYDEPPPWYQSVRQFLGAVLFSEGRFAEAENVYREDLKRNPENGWSLFGLAKSLESQNKTEEARKVKQRFQKAWKRADVSLKASRF